MSLGGKNYVTAGNFLWRISQMDYFTLWLHQIKTPISAISLLMQRDNQMNYRNQMEQELLRIENYTHMALNYVRIEQSGMCQSFLCKVQKPYL